MSVLIHTRTIRRTILRHIAVTVIFGAASITGASAATTLKALSFIPKNNPVMAEANAWTALVNEKMKGKVKINYMGGPEVIGRYQQPDALRKGIVDVLFTAVSAWQSEVPEVSAFTLSKISPTEERKSGFYDHMVKALDKLGVRYIGRAQIGSFYLWVKDKPAKLADLKGVKMRTGSLYDRFMSALGMVPVSIPTPEVYTALQQGVVDGFGWPNIGPRKLGWTTKVHYVIDLPFFGASNVAIVMNLKKWQSLGAAEQKQLTDITAAFEPKMVAAFKASEDAEWKKLAGVVTRVKFSPAENKKYLDTAYQVEWNAVAKHVSPETLQILRKTTGND